MGLLTEGLANSVAFVTALIICCLVILYYMRKDGLKREYEEWGLITYVRFVRRSLMYLSFGLK